MKIHSCQARHSCKRRYMYYLICRGPKWAKNLFDFHGQQLTAATLMRAVIQATYHAVLRILAKGLSATYTLRRLLQPKTGTVPVKMQKKPSSCPCNAGEKVARTHPA